MRRRSLTQTDRAAWANYARLVAPLPTTIALEPPPPAKPPAPPPAVASAPVATPRTAAARTVAPARTPPAPLSVNDAPGGLDRATYTRFRSGKLPATRTLDLHGRTAQRAHAALIHFLHAATAEGTRCVEVITGRGSGETGGVIRREFPLWLNQPDLRPLILAAAHPHALNPGSVRLLLKRRRLA